MPIVHRRCDDCGREYDLLDWHGDLCSLDNDPEDDLSCPTCGSTDATAIVKGGTGINLGGGASTGRVYPYFDRGLDMWIDSHAHRERVCKERGLVPRDEKPSDGGRDRTEAQRAFEESAAEGARYLKQVEEDSAFAGLRLQREKQYQLDSGRWVPWYAPDAVRERMKRGQG